MDNKRIVREIKASDVQEVLALRLEMLCDSPWVFLRTEEEFLKITQEEHLA